MFLKSNVDVQALFYILENNDDNTALTFVRGQIVNFSK